MGREDTFPPMRYKGRNPVEVRRSKKLRKKETYGERVLWTQLRNRRFHGLKFRPQASIDKYIVDFYCAEKKLIIEVDGEHHKYQRGYDAKRQQFIEHMGYRFIRFDSLDVYECLDRVLAALEEKVLVSPPSEGGGRGRVGKADQ